MIGGQFDYPTIGGQFDYPMIGGQIDCRELQASTTYA
jgi:hypothetical protein